MITLFSQSVLWSGIAALPLLILALVMGRLPLPARLKMWTCRLALVKLFIGLIPIGVTVVRPTVGAIHPDSQLRTLILALTVLWLLGVVTVLVDLVRAYAASRRMLIGTRMTVEPIAAQLAGELGIRCPELRRGVTDGLPFAFGVVRPVVVLPREGCPPSVLAHELAHVQSRDLLWNLIARLTVAVFWFVPFIHRLETEMGLWQEAVADQAACRATGCERAVHARAIVASVATGRPLVWEARLSGNGMIVGRRLKALYGDGRFQIWGLMLIVVMLLAAVPVRVLQPMGPRLRMKAMSAGPQEPVYALVVATR